MMVKQRTRQKYRILWYTGQAMTTATNYEYHSFVADTDHRTITAQTSLKYRHPVNRSIMNQ